MCVCVVWGTFKGHRSSASLQRKQEKDTSARAKGSHERIYGPDAVHKIAAFNTRAVLRRCPCRTQIVQGNASRQNHRAPST
jgi:hypothetical protein